LLMRLTGGRLPVQCGPEHPLAATGLAAQPVLADRGEAERAFALAERLGSVNAATPSGHDLAIAAQGFHPPRPGHARPQPRSRPPARYRHGQPPRRPAGHPDPGPGVCFAQSWRPPRPRSADELYQWVRREEQYAILGANVVVELYSESHARQQPPGLGDHPTSRPQPPAGRPTRQPPRPPPRRPSRPSRPSRPHQPVPPTPGAGDGGRCPLSPPAPTSEQRAVPHSLSTLMSLAHDPRRHQVMSRLSTIPKGAQSTRNQPIYWSRG
jgi:hypothetical protein